jgi:hypothetical protein
MINFNSVCLFKVLSLKYFMYNSIANVVYVSMYSDMFYILWPAGQIGSMEFEIKYLSILIYFLLLTCMTGLSH